MPDRPKDSAGSAHDAGAPARPVLVQPSGFLLELTPDWLVLRASENCHRFLGQYPQAVIGEPLSDFTLAQPLHDVRNLFSRQSRDGRIARAYRVRLTTEQRYFDLAFQLCDGRILLEGVISADETFGGALGSIAGMIDGMASGSDERFMDDVARRLRALTGFDRVTMELGGRTVESCRGAIAARPDVDTHCLVWDTAATPVPLFPAQPDRTVARAVLNSPPREELKQLAQCGIGATMDLSLIKDGEPVGAIRCDNRTARAVSLEQHAAAELFAQIAGMRLG